MKATAVVVTYNRASILNHCIEKLLAQSVDDYEVIVIDDGSSDSTRDVMKKIKDKRFRYFRNKEKKGQPYARNKGIKHSKGDIIIFVDSDVLVDKNFIRDHIKLHKKITQAVDKKEFLLVPRVSSVAQEEKIRSALIAPIIDPTGCFGVLYIDNTLDHEHYSLSDLDYLMLLTIHTAAIVENF